MAISVCAALASKLQASKIMCPVIGTLTLHPSLKKSSSGETFNKVTIINLDQPQPLFFKRDFSFLGQNVSGSLPLYLSCPYLNFQKDGSSYANTPILILCLETCLKVWKFKKEIKAIRVSKKTIFLFRSKSELRKKQFFQNRGPKPIGIPKDLFLNSWRTATICEWEYAERFFWTPFNNLRHLGGGRKSFVSYSMKNQSVISYVFFLLKKIFLFNLFTLTLSLIHCGTDIYTHT